MSSRAIRRLRQEKEAALTSEHDDESISEEDLDELRAIKAFSMLEESSDEDDDEEFHEDPPAKIERIQPQPSVHPPPEEDFDAILSSVMDETTKLQPSSPPPTPSTSTMRSILLSKHYDMRHLDLDRALRSLLELEPAPKSKIGTKRRRHPFGKPRDTWGKPPSFVGGGLGTVELTPQFLLHERDDWTVPRPYDAVPPERMRWHSLLMSDTYREVYFRWKKSKGLEDANALAMFVADHPHFVETLFQLAMVLYHVDDRERGNDLLKRCLHIYEIALPSAVLPHQDDDADVELLVDIDRTPNSNLFETLFRIMQTHGMAGCHGAALAVGRFLLSLDPLRDPMGVLLILDYYALTSRVNGADGGNELGASFVVEMVQSKLVKVHYEDPLTGRMHLCELEDMPGFAFSYALALRRLEGNGDAAEEALIRALEKFPRVLSKLLTMNKVNLQDRSFRMDWPRVLSHFSEGAGGHDAGGSMQDRIARAAGDHLVRIFVQRHYKLWGADDVLPWLYHCSEKIVQSKSAPSLGSFEEGSETTSSSSPDAVSPAGVANYSPALARYAQCNPSDYEDSFQTFPPEAIDLNPNIVAPAMALDPNRRRFLPGGQFRGQDGRGGMEGGLADRGLMGRLREAMGVGDGLGMGDGELLDPDSPLLQLYLQSLLPWAQVDGVRPARR